MSIWKTIGDSNFIKFLKWAISNDAKKKEKDSAVIKRARDEKGQYQGDDESTPDVNEAWVGGKSPNKKKRK
tara:strand:+ start:186 stop:398 length:213 start_codon:yes stop_codon:yes gene_type:complete